MSRIRHAVISLLGATAMLAVTSAAVSASPHTQGPVMRFAGSGNTTLRVSSSAYDRAEVIPIVATLRSFVAARRDTVSVYVADPAEISRMCGVNTMSCYDSYDDEITISGADEAIAGVPRDFALAHEYGHHLANHSAGSLRPALTTGTMKWATRERVCELSRSHVLFPGNEGLHYWDNPGEAFAQSYAELNFPDSGVAWNYSQLLAPDEASLTALRADIEHPWAGPTKSAWNVGGGSTAIGAATYERRFATPLDGKIGVSVVADPGSRMRITLRDPATGKVLDRTSQRAGKLTHLSYPNCGARKLDLEISNPQQLPFRAKLIKP